MKFEKLFQNLAIWISKFSKTCYFALSLFSKETNRTSIPSNYIYFIKPPNEWVACDIIRLLRRLGNAYFEN